MPKSIVFQNPFYQKSETNQKSKQLCDLLLGHDPLLEKCCLTKSCAASSQGSPWRRKSKSRTLPSKVASWLWSTKSKGRPRKQKRSRRRRSRPFRVSRYGNQQPLITLFESIHGLILLEKAVTMKKAQRYDQALTGPEQN